MDTFGDDLIARAVLALDTGVDAGGFTRPNGVDQDQSNYGTLKIYSENDGAFHDPFDGYDRHYSSGQAFVFQHRPEWAGQLIEFMPFNQTFNDAHANTSVGAGYVLGQLIFNPANLTAIGPVRTDQPYAGYLYGGVFLQRQGDLKTGGDGPRISVLDHFEVNLGVVGEEALGKDVQTWVHDNFQGDDPRGWNNQLDTEPTAQLYYKRKWRIEMGAIGEGPEALDMQLIPQVGVAVGTVYRNVSAAATFRIGQNLPDDFGPGRVDDLQSAAGDPLLGEGWSWYVFTRVGGRLVEHELFLDGSTWDNPSLSVERNVGVAEIQGGLAVGYRPNANHRFDLTWGVTYSTDRFDAPGATGTNSYGTVVFSWEFSY